MAVAQKWLLKTEPTTYSIDDLKKDKTTEWEGVRNYQARNLMQTMEVGEECFIYHSNAEPPGIVGLAKVSKKAFADPAQFDKKSKYYEPKATKEKPRWFCPEVKFVKKFKEIIPLGELREQKALKDMPLLKKGMRLSVQPVSEKEFRAVIKLVD